MRTTSEFYLGVFYRDGRGGLPQDAFAIFSGTWRIHYADAMNAGYPTRQPPGGLVEGLKWGMRTRSGDQG